MLDQLKLSLNTLAFKGEALLLTFVGIIDASRGCWLKTALHAHSTSSDGRLSPGEVVDFYRKSRYGIVSITDHGKVTKPGNYYEELVYLPGCELSLRAANKEYHVIIVGLDELPPRNIKGLKEVVNWAVDEGYFVSIAHPYWSMISGSELLMAGMVHAIEVYNHGCEVEISRGHSEQQLDYVLHNKGFAYCTAVDDAHYYSIDGDGGWVFLYLEGYSREKALEALKNGRFYSSSGPIINLLDVSRNRILLECSPVLKVKVISGGTRGLYIDARLLGKVEHLKKLGAMVEVWETENGKNFEITIGGIKINGRLVDALLTMVEIEGKLPFSRYVRIEAIEPGGEKAWSNPLML